MILRLTHNILGMLIAPSILMFAFTGGLMIFRLHESHPNYVPMVLIEKLGRVHKDQVFEQRPPKKPRPDAGAAGGGAKAPDEKKPAPALSKVLLQWFFVIVAGGLFLSTALGVWLGATMGRYKVVGRWALVAGTAIPVAILLIP